MTTNTLSPDGIQPTLLDASETSQGKHEDAVPNEQVTDRHGDNKSRKESRADSIEERPDPMRGARDHKVTKSKHRSTVW